MDSRLTITEQDAGDVTVLVMTGQILLDDGDLAFRKVIRRGRPQLRRPGAIAGARNTLVLGPWSLRLD